MGLDPDVLMEKPYHTVQSWLAFSSAYANFCAYETRRRSAQNAS